MKIRFLIPMLAFALSSCLVEQEDEFVEAVKEQPSIVEFVRASKSKVVVDGDEQTHVDTVYINLGGVAHPLDTDTRVQIAIDEANSTAVEGTDFDLLNADDVVIRSGERSAFIVYRAKNVETFDPFAPPYFTIQLTTAGGSVVASNKGQMRISLQKICNNDLSGTYRATNDFCDPAPFEVTITRSGVGEYLLSSADGGFLSTCTSNTGLWNSGTIIEVCGTILPSTALEYGTDGGFGIGDILGGTWDEDAGILILNNQDVDFTQVGGWTSTYTRID